MEHVDIVEVTIESVAIGEPVYADILGLGVFRGLVVAVHHPAKPGCRITCPGCYSIVRSYKSYCPECSIPLDKQMILMKYESGRRSDWFVPDALSYPVSYALARWVKGCSND